MLKNKGLVVLVIVALVLSIAGNVSANCPKLDDTEKRFPIDNQDMFCYGLQILRTFSELEYILYEDGSFGIEGCIPKMGCTP